MSEMDLEQRSWLQRISERVPMTDYTAEQMPELMPRVMDNLMPHMIGDAVPLITQPMIDYLRQKNPVPAGLGKE